MEKTEEFYVSSAFSGCDIVLYLDERVIGEMQSIEFNEDLKTGKVAGHIDVCVFDRTYRDLKEAFVAEGDKDILIRYRNEVGGEMTTFIASTEFHARRVVNNIDDYAIVHRYFFTAEQVDDQFITE